MEKERSVLRQTLYTVCLYLSFHSLWGTVDGQCGGTAKTETFSYDTIVVSTPGYNTGYAVDLDCKWLFTTDITGSIIIYRFANIHVDCADALASYDGTTTSASSIESGVCNIYDATNALKKTTGTNLLVTFTSDSTTTPNDDIGAQVEAVSGKDYSQCSSSSTISLTSSQTVAPLSTPNFPLNYNTNMDCEWVITASDSSATVSINFTFLEIDFYSGTCYSYIEVYDGTTLLEKFCSSIDFSPNKFFSTTGNTMKVKFHADTAAKRGFLAKYYETGGGGGSQQQTVSEESSSCPASSCVVPATICTVAAAAGITGLLGFLFYKGIVKFPFTTKPQTS